MQLSSKSNMMWQTSQPHQTRQSAHRRTGSDWSLQSVSWRRCSTQKNLFDWCIYAQLERKWKIDLRCFFDSCRLFIFQFSFCTPLGPSWICWTPNIVLSAVLSRHFAHILATWGLQKKLWTQHKHIITVYSKLNCLFTHPSPIFTLF